MAQRKRQNSVRLGKDGLIRINFHGPQSASTVRATLLKTQSVLNDAFAKNAPRLVLARLDKGVTEDAGAIKVGMQFMRIGFEKAAIYGGTARLGKLTNRVIQAAGVEGRVRYFEEAGEAKSWLQEMPALERPNQTLLLARTLPVVVLGTAIIPLSGWFLNQPLWRRFAADFPPVNPVMALSVAALAFSTMVKTTQHAGRSERRRNLIANALLALLTSGGIIVALGVLFDE